MVEVCRQGSLGEALAESSGSLLTLHTCFSQNSDIAAELDLSSIPIWVGKRECIGTLLGEGQDEDRLTSGQQGGCLGEEGVKEPCAGPGPEGLALAEIRWERED